MSGEETSDIHQEQPPKPITQHRRRRRKRTRAPAVSKRCQPFSVDDQHLEFLRAKSPRDVNNSVLSLLLEREHGFASRIHGASMHERNVGSSRRRFQWQERMTRLEQDTYELMQQGPKWRPWVEQRIPFTALETPVQLAILAVEANTGSFALGLTQVSSTCAADLTRGILSSAGATPVPATLSISLVGLPSNNSRSQKRRVDLRGGGRKQDKRRIGSVAPRLMTIPLAFDDDDTLAWVGETSRQHRMHQEEPLEEWYGHKRVDVCISSDWRVGLAICRMPSATQSIPTHSAREPQASTRIVSLVLFSLDMSETRNLNDSEEARESDNNQLDVSEMARQTVFRAMHVPISTTFGFNGRNLLWQVSQVPVVCESNWEINHTYNFPAKLLLIDDGEGYRMTWCADRGWGKGDQVTADPVNTCTLDNTLLPNSNRKIQWRTSKRTIVSSIPDSEPPYWKQRLSDRQTGCGWMDDDEDDDDGDDRLKQRKRQSPKIQIVQEAQLLILSLLSDILDHRPALRAPHANPKSNDSNQDVFPIPDFDYEIVSVSHGGRVMKILIGFSRVVVNSRRTQQHVAVLIALDIWTQNYQELQWVQTASLPGALGKHVQQLALNFRAQELNLQKPTGAGKGKEGELRQNEKLPLASYYPDCELVSNQNVMQGIPVMSLPSRSPVELVYG